MECQRGIFSSFCIYPFQRLHFPVKGDASGCCISDNKKEKWKSRKEMFFLHTQLLFFLHLLICAVQSVSGQAWDGVIVTQADFQALQAFKHKLVDNKGFLRSRNDSGYGACSGGWMGIKCAQGQVIVIQLPWRGLGGRITEKIGQLQALRKLSLHDNLIGGPIPTALGFLPNVSSSSALLRWRAAERTAVSSVVLPTLCRRYHCRHAC